MHVNFVTTNVLWMPQITCFNNAIANAEVIYG
jgi:hypothetical protein